MHTSVAKVLQKPKCYIKIKTKRNIMIYSTCSFVWAVLKNEIYREPSTTIDFRECIANTHVVKITETLKKGHCSFKIRLNKCINCNITWNTYFDNIIVINIDFNTFLHKIRIQEEILGVPLKKYEGNFHISIKMRKR